MNLISNDCIKENMFVVDVLRASLLILPLPSNDSCGIDKYIDQLSKKYFTQNKNNFTDSSVVYVLMYSIIMLNTDLHSEKIKTKMSLNQFISMNKGINNGTDLPMIFLEKVYWDVKSNKLIL